MKTFAIDFASHEGHLACLEGDAVRAIRVVGRVNDTEMIPLAEAVISQAGWTLNDIEHIACNVGPGGFTSVRGGVAFANALADQLQIPVAGYHASALVLARCAADLWLHSTKADALFALGGAWPEPTLVALADLPAHVTTVCGDLLDAHKAALAERGAVLVAPKPLEAVLPAFLEGLAYDREGLVPWYGRGL